MKTKNILLVLFLIALGFMVLYIILGMNVNNYKYLIMTRIPKITAIILTGGTIAVSTVIFQTISNNRILTPSMLGFDSLFMLIQTVIVFFLGSSSRLIVNNNINFALTTLIMVAASVFLFRFLFRKIKNNLMFLLLIGTVVGTLFRSITSFLQMIIDPNEFSIIQNKMFASFNNVNINILFLAIVIILLIIPFIYDDFKFLDVIALGRDHAINLGIEYEKFVSKALIIIAILVSISTALIGPIMFLGLLVVNLAREISQSYKHSHLIAISIALSTVFLVGGQFIVERLLNFNTTLSVIINFVGGIYMILILLKENRI